MQVITAVTDLCLKFWYSGGSPLAENLVNWCRLGHINSTTYLVVTEQIWIVHSQGRALQLLMACSSRTHFLATHLLVSSTRHVSLVLGSNFGLRLTEVQLPVLDLNFPATRLVACVVERPYFGANCLQVRRRR